MVTPKAKDVDEYISGFENDVQKILKQIRSTVKKAAPLAEETIKYAIPTYVFHGNLVHFAAYKKHIGFYPAPSGIEAFEKELSAYKGAKGSIQFPINQKIPFKLISKIVKFRITENLEKSAKKIDNLY